MEIAYSLGILYIIKITVETAFWTLSWTKWESERERAVTMSETSDFLNPLSVSWQAWCTQASVGVTLGWVRVMGECLAGKKPHNYISVWLRHCADLDYLWTSLNERLEESLWEGHKTNNPDCYIRVDSQIICQPKIREGDCLRVP